MNKSKTRGSEPVGGEVLHSVTEASLFCVLDLRHSGVKTRPERASTLVSRVEQPP